MNQFLLGASVPYAIALLIYAGRRFRTGPVMLIVAPLMMAVCGVWAIVPDLPRILGRRRRAGVEGGVVPLRLDIGLPRIHVHSFEAGTTRSRPLCLA